MCTEEGWRLKIKSQRETKELKVLRETSSLLYKMSYRKTKMISKKSQKNGKEKSKRLHFKWKRSNVDIPTHRSKADDSGRNNKMKLFNNWLQCFVCLATSEVKLKTNKEHVQ